MPIRTRQFAPALVIAAALVAACGQKDAGTPQTPAPAGEAMTKAIEAQGAANQAAAATASAASAAEDASQSAAAAGTSTSDAQAAAAAAAAAATMAASA